MKEFIEKLICRLEEISVSRDNDGVINGCNMGICEDDDCLKCLKKKVISIVNELAEEHNNGFCEWKLDGVYLLCQHNTELVISCLEEEKHRYTYCPYCGKKIKVVE